MKEYLLMCDTIFGFEIDVLGECVEGFLFWTILIVYFFMIVLAHKVNTMTYQIQRESLHENTDDRPICEILRLEFVRNIIRILFIIFVASMNVWFILVSFPAHLLGIWLVFRSQRMDADHKFSNLGGTTQFRF